MAKGTVRPSKQTRTAIATNRVTLRRLRDWSRIANIRVSSFDRDAMAMAAAPAKRALRSPVTTSSKCWA